MEGETIADNSFAQAPSDQDDGFTDSPVFDGGSLHLERSSSCVPTCVSEDAFPFFTYPGFCEAGSSTIHIYGKKPKKHLLPHPSLDREGPLQVKDYYDPWDERYYLMDYDNPRHLDYPPRNSQDSRKMNGHQGDVSRKEWWEKSASTGLLPLPETTRPPSSLQPPPPANTASRREDGLLPLPPPPPAPPSYPHPPAPPSYPPPSIPPPYPHLPPSCNPPPPPSGYPHVPHIL